MFLSAIKPAADIEVSKLKSALLSVNSVFKNSSPRTFSSGGIYIASKPYFSLLIFAAVPDESPLLKFNAPPIPKNPAFKTDRYSHKLYHIKLRHSSYVSKIFTLPFNTIFSGVTSRAVLFSFIK